MTHSQDLQLAPAMNKCLNEAVTFLRIAQTQWQESLTSGCALSRTVFVLEAAALKMHLERGGGEFLSCVS